MTDFEGVDMKYLYTVLSYQSDKHMWFPAIAPNDINAAYDYIERAYVSPLLRDTIKHYSGEEVDQLINYQILFSFSYLSIPPFLIEQDDKIFIEVCSRKGYDKDAMRRIDLRRVGQIALKFIKLFCCIRMEKGASDKRYEAIVHLLGIMDPVEFDLDETEHFYQDLLDEVVPRNHSLNRVLSKMMFPFILDDASANCGNATVDSLQFDLAQFNVEATLGA